jgi:hypothetical protein
MDSELLANLPRKMIGRNMSGSSLSCKEISVTIPSNEWVGHVLFPTGKKAVMFWLSPSHAPKFSLLQGHQVFKNAMVLFINVDIHDR